MTNTDRDTRAVRLLGIGFSVLFTAGLTALLGDLVGAFADSSTTFTYFDSSGERLKHALGAYVLTASGLIFMAFVERVTRSFEATDSSSEGRTARLAAGAFAALTGLAAAAFATVSLSIGFGQITGDPGIQDGRELLPQLGYVVLFVPAALSAGYAVFLVARGAARTSRLPRWMIGAGYLVAAAQLFSFYALPLFLLPLWLLGTGISFRPSGAAQSASL